MQCHASTWDAAARRGLIRTEAVATSAALTECPLNFHQAANYVCCVKAGVPLITKLTFAAGSLLLVTLQFCVAGTLMWSAAHPTCIDSSQCGHDRACIFHESGFGDISKLGQYNPDEPGECKNCYEIYVLHEDIQGEYSVHYVAGQVAPMYLRDMLDSESPVSNASLKVAMKHDICHTVHIINMLPEVLTTI